ncbi:MAG: DUF3800 domain-containing protein [Lachnospiraceae bacterium]|nr:DUF3800 domain-containing protein [Lachnospiraceae bacterium]
MKRYNVYCDESCHLEKDLSPVMILGAMYCPAENKKQIYDEIRAIKAKHNISSFFEIKWTKVSASKIDFYLELLDYFWNNQDLLYRGLVASGKQSLDHDKYNGGDYDLWYYKMYYRMLDPVISPNDKYHIMVDIKDTRGGKRVAKLREVLCNNIYDFKKEVIDQIGQINSKESEILQLADLINGALAFYHRGLADNLDSNAGKIGFVRALQKYVDLDNNTKYGERKFNLFIWKPKE